MTNQEAKLKFDVLFDAIATNQAPPTEPEEYNTLLNKAMFELIGMLNFAKAHNKLTEITIVEELSLAPCTLEQLGPKAYQSTTELTNELLYLVSSKTYITSRSSLITDTNYWMDNSETNRDLITYYAQRPFNRQILVKPKLYLHYNQSTAKTTPIILVDSDTTISYLPVENRTLYPLEIVYIRKPVLIDISGTDNAEYCELHESLHEQIIDMATKLAIVSTDADRLKMIMPQQQQQGTQ